jgi:hypothetical protein
MKALKTKYNGIEYRSKLEARWAVFFDHYGLKFEYEPGSFKLKNGILYCPDFLLLDLDCYCEIKPLITEVKNGYCLHKFENNIVGLKHSEYLKLINFELPIILCCGLPLERNFIKFNCDHNSNFDLGYPTFDYKLIPPAWRWWSSNQISDFPTMGDIRKSAEYARYYDFFNFYKKEQPKEGSPF